MGLYVNVFPYLHLIFKYYIQLAAVASPPPHPFAFPEAATAWYQHVPSLCTFYTLTMYVHTIDNSAVVCVLDFT